MSSIQSKKLISVFILETLKRYSDENNRLKQSQIIDHLRNDYDMIVDRKTVQRNLLDLISCGKFDIGYTEVTRKKQNSPESEEYSMLKDIYMQQPISDGELRLLIDSVLFSQSIPSKQAEDLIERLKGLSCKPVTDVHVILIPGNYIFLCVIWHGLAKNDDIIFLLQKSFLLLYDDFV